ncbi:LOW QUALITY PROTEIN: conserved hypothetical protein, partial [Streptomyces viridochromogenes DSM 40736]
MTTPDFRPTHVVPQHGMPAWEAPDPARPTVDLDPLLPVQLLERQGDWGHVLCLNGWSAWSTAAAWSPYRRTRPRRTARSPAPPTRVRCWGARRRRWRATARRSRISRTASTGSRSTPAHAGCASVSSSTASPCGSTTPRTGTGCTPRAPGRARTRRTRHPGP